MAKSRSTPSAPLFESVAAVADSASRPLADRLRPALLAEVIGQDHLLGEGAPLRRIAEGERPRSMIFWGPPGTGKTTAARLMARGAGMHFEQLSAIFSGVQDLRKVFEAARDR
jgi:putative ATPase